ncbi:MAG: ABC transporter ATP-binding protein [Candidatus Babeliales bacterium]
MKRFDDSPSKFAEPGGPDKRSRVKGELRIEHVSKQFKQGETATYVLTDVNALFTQGGTYAITGASGSGKSTLLYLLAGLDTPTTGNIYFNNELLNTLDEQKRTHLLNQSFGLVFQLPYLIAELSVLENVMLKGIIAGQAHDMCIEKAQQLLARIGLQEKAARNPLSLSGGQQQRVAIARALFNKPAFLLADEPTGNLDERTAHSIIDFLLECQQEWGMGMIISSHDAYVADAMQHVLHLHNGHLTQVR